MTGRIFLLMLLIGLLKAKLNYSFSRDNVGVWMNLPDLNVLKSDDSLTELIKCVGSTFGTILWSHPSRMLEKGSGSAMPNPSLFFPVIAARYNHNKFVSALNNTTTYNNNALNNKPATTGSKTNETINVIMSFDVLPTSLYEDQKRREYMELHNLTDDNLTIHSLNTKSVEGAKFLAEFANKEYNGTVDTLLLLNEDYLDGETYDESENKAVRLEETLYSVKWARNTLANQLGAREYKLGVLLPYEFFLVDDDEQNLQTAGIKVEILMNVDVIVVATVNDDQFDDYTVEYSNLVKIIEATDSFLRDLKLNVTMIPLIFCNNREPYHPQDVDLDRFKCWQLMNNWAIINHRKIIMYEALEDRYARFKRRGLSWWVMRHKPGESSSKLTQNNFFAKADLLWYYGQWVMSMREYYY
ncbi:unnamed protein product [Orchesella dallaii]|uniref:Uncharacterized protein n=1 Tax=Orchesella dallaii TaxID=48710 RepID=A0ABP1PV64_9HEXA